MLKPLSSAPLQSSSTVLPHRSADGDPCVTLHTAAAPPEPQINVPLRAHAPTPTVHGVPNAKPLSRLPSQSSSTVLPHSSAVPVPATALHVTPFCAPLHTVVPLRRH